MNKLPIAAAALLFGTSAFAMLSAAQPAPAAPPVYDEAPALQPAAVNSWTSADAWETTDANAADKGAASKDQAADGSAEILAEPGLHTAAYTTGFDGADKAAAETVAMTDTGDTAAVDMASATLAPRAAAQNYPACRPGRGDDHCIQLYEPGVRAELASWTQPTGGFAGSGDMQVAMGGPYEPAEDSASATERLNQQALAASSNAVQTASVDTGGMDRPLDDSVIQTAQADDAMATAADEPAAEDVAEI